MSLLAAAAENREAGPIGLVLVLLLAVALVFLIRSMNKHLRKIPGDFSRSADAPAPLAGPEPVGSEAARRESPADPAEPGER